jgi:lipoprotein-anchoring transpeptidase ErfK/SrfK
MKSLPVSRRDFLKLTALGVGAFILPITKISSTIRKKTLRSLYLPEFPNARRLGRVLVGKTEIKARPDSTSATVADLYENAVVPWLREVTGSNPYRYVQRYVETPDGFIWSPHLQQVQNNINEEVKTILPDYSGGLGMWVEVTVPYVDLVLANPPVRSPAFQAGVPQRLYFKQVVWADEIITDEDNVVWYRLNEKSGSYGDIFYAPAKALRVIPPEEVYPISPDFPNEEKKIVININENVQTLACYEGKDEVYFARISAGRRADIDGNITEKSATPVGSFGTSWKLHSIHMSGGASGVGWDLIGVAWPSFFTEPGIAIHSTFWHNNFGGEYMSRGCVNMLPEDSKWVWRWSLPTVPYDAVEVREVWTSENRTQVQVIEF